MDLRMYLVYIIFLVLVNGFPNHLFKAVRGLRQGDPMFPLIFMIVSKALGALLSRQRTLGLLRVLRWADMGRFLLTFSLQIMLFSLVLQG